MRARTKARSKKGSGNGGRRSDEVSNQLAFNVICLALAVGGNAATEPCQSSYED